MLIDGVMAILLISPDAKAVFERLAASAVDTMGPSDHGFGIIVSFRDPDGNVVEILEAHEQPSARSFDA